MNVSLHPTTMVRVLDNFNEICCVRALLTTSLNCNVITAEYANRLGLERVDGFPKLVRCDDQIFWTFGHVTLMPNYYNQPIECMVVAALNLVTPSEELDSRIVTSVTEPVSLADPDFHRPRGIDLVFGSDVTMNCINGGFQSFNNGLILLDTVFGKVALGDVEKY